MKEVAKYIYDHQDRPETEIIIHGLHDKKGMFLQYMKNQSVQTTNKALAIMGIPTASLYPQTTSLVLFLAIKEHKEEILNQFNKLFFK